MYKYGFVYLWRDKKHKRFYVGCHWGSVNDGYICSSRWMMKSYKRRPQDFKRRILKTNIVDRKDLLNEEYEFLKRIKDDELGKKYYNMSNKKFEHWSTNEQTKMTVGQKISAKRKGKCSGENNNFYGRTHNEETKIKIKEKRAKQTFSEETRKKLSAANKGENNFFYGKKYSEEEIKSLSKQSKLLWQNDEYKQLQSVLKKGRVIINNGVETKMVFPNDIPDGWTRGRIKNGN